MTPTLQIRPLEALIASPENDELPAQLLPFDLPAALKRTNGKPSLLRRLLLEFRDQYAQTIPALRQTLEEKRLPEAERLVHSLKSIAAMMHASELAEAAQAIESTLQIANDSGRARQPDPGELETMIQQLETTLTPAIAAAATLERRMPQDASTDITRSIVDRGPKARTTILAVDDQTIGLELLTDILEDEYRVLTARDGQTALDIAFRLHPDLILLDIHLPGMNGYEVLRQLQADPEMKKIPVIFVTGSNALDDEIEGLRLGAVDYVTKPIHPAVVKARVNNQIKLKRAERELLRLSAKDHLDEMVHQLERSARRDLQQELQLQVMDDFLSHVSHELRSPLSSIYTFVTLIADEVAGKTTEQQQEYLRIVLLNAAHLKSMVDDLLEATRLGTGKLKVEMQRISIADSIDYMLQTLSGAARAKSIKLSSTIAPDLDTAYADPMRLRQTLIVLADNALKFTPAGGEVRIEAKVFEQDPGFVLIVVSDSGCGISAEQIEFIFERLYQIPTAPQSGDRGRQGLGLGLHIAKELVRRQGGQLWAESTPGEGSRFYFTVPLAAAAGDASDGDLDASLR